jgi:PhnB protein
MLTQHAPAGFHTVTPYLTVDNAVGLIEFIIKTFQAEVVRKITTPTGQIANAVVKIGDSVIEISDAQGDWKSTPCALHVYVPDSNYTHKCAVSAGATVLHEPMDMDYGERASAVRDLTGNNWYIATRTSDA